MIVSKIIIYLNFCFDVAKEICNLNETNKFITIDFFSIAHNNLITKIEKNETNIVLKINVKNVFVKNISKSCKKMKFD